MRVNTLIEQADVIHKILEHLGLWGNRRKPATRASPSLVRCVVEDVNGYLPTPDDDMIGSHHSRGRAFLIGAFRAFGSARLEIVASRPLPEVSD